MTDTNYDEAMAILENEDRPTIEDYDEFSRKMAQAARDFDMALREIPAEEIEAIKLEAANQTWEWAWEFYVKRKGKGVLGQIIIYLIVDDGIDISRMGNTFTGWALEELKENKDNFIFESLQYMVTIQAEWIRETEERRENIED